MIKEKINKYLDRIDEKVPHANVIVDVLFGRKGRSVFDKVFKKNVEVLTKDEIYRNLKRVGLTFEEIEQVRDLYARSRLIALGRYMNELGIRDRREINENIIEDDKLFGIYTFNDDFLMSHEIGRSEAIKINTLTNDIFKKLKEELTVIR